MDPLSITASIVALISFTGEVSRTLRRLHSIRKGPEYLIALLNELADFQVILSTLQCIVQSPTNVTYGTSTDSDRQHSNVSSQLVRQIERADSVLKRLQILVQRVSNDPASTQQPRKFKYVTWARCQKDFNQTREEMKALKGEIHLTITLLTHCDTSHISLQLCAIEAGVHELRNSRTETQPDVIGTELTPSESQSTIHANILNIPSVVQSGADIVQIGADYNFGTSCQPWCTCTCHSERHYRTPSMLQSILGTLFLGYLGRPFIHQLCSNRSCHRRSRVRTRVTYFFPYWFLSLAVSVLISGPTTSISVLPMRGKDDIIFTFASGGNDHELLTLIDAGRASPCDIDPQGWGLLHWAARFGALSTCRTLLSLGADASIENSSHMSARDLATRWCLQTKGRITQEYYDVFGYKSSPRLEELGFTRLHKALFKMLRTDLSTELQLSAAAINQKDSKGATPLLWATQLQNSDAVRLLLESGANPRLYDAMGATPLHFGWSLPYQEFLRLLEHGADPNALDAYKETPLHHCCRNLNELDFTKALIRYGADLNLRDLNGWAPMHWLARYDFSDIMEHFLDLGATVDPQSYIGWTPLFFSVRYNSHSSLRLLLKYGADISLVSLQGDSVWHYAAAFADKQTMEILDGYTNNRSNPLCRSFAWPAFKEGVSVRELFRHTRSSTDQEDLCGTFEHLLRGLNYHAADERRNPCERREEESSGTRAKEVESELERADMPGSWTF